MNDKEYYFREDWKEFKKKFIMLCRQCVVEDKIIKVSLAQLKNK